MKLEDQFCSLKLSKKLKELGVKQDSLGYWSRWICMPNNSFDIGEMKLIIAYERKPSIDVVSYSAFTVAELGEIFNEGLTYNIISFKKNSKWICIHNTLWNYDSHQIIAKTEADARAKMLIYLIENNYMVI